MSIILNSTTSKTKDAAGYFRIGFVSLQIPPESIVTSRIANNDKLTTLRNSGEMYVKTGQARWDVTIRWVALKGEPGAEDYLTQWEDLTDIVAMFKVAPFVEVESPYLRQIFAPVGSPRMAVALRQLRVDTHPDIVDGLSVTLTMSLFNYSPYSLDFSYKGEGGQASDAYRSQAFKDYIRAWKAKTNEAPDWRTQTPGSLTFRWRKYLPVLTGETPKLGPIVTTSAAPTARRTPSSGQQVSTGVVAGSGNQAAYDALILKEAKAKGIDPALIKAYIEQESLAFQADSINPGTTGLTASAVRARIMNDADGGVAFCNEAMNSGKTPPDIGLMQINWRTLKGLQSDITPKQALDPAVNIALGAKQIQWLLANGMTDTTYWKYNTGLNGKFVTPEVAVKMNWTDSASYQASISSKRAKWSRAGLVDVTAPTPPPPSPPIAIPVPGQTLDGIEKTDKFMQTDTFMRERGWALDYNTADGTLFYYKEQEMSLVSGDTPPTATSVLSTLPTQLSVLFINNLAQIPLAGHQYPTYQHIGPASSLISIVVESKGESTIEGDEPKHPGVQWLTTMAHALEEQYRKLRTTFRRVNSVHRMQAVTVQNDVLNLLGIRGVLLDQVTTETVTDAADLVLVNVTGSQYENIFEDIGPYKADSQHAAYRDLGLTDLTIDPGTYFVNDNTKYRDETRKNVEAVLKATKKAEEDLNKPAEGTQISTTTTSVIGMEASMTVTGTPMESTPVTTSSIFPIVGHPLPTDPDEVMRMTHIPGYNMAEAFPTFKLFFLEDANQGIFRQFDNFYSYASITDIEIIKPKDKPWTMVLQMTNLAHLLNHKLFDDTEEGRLEAEYHKYNIRSQTDSSGAAVIAPDGAQMFANGGKMPGVSPYADYSAPGSQKRVPLKYFPLQTGTKVQLRIGYANNPDELTPVFGGIVTEIHGTEILTITCQSFLLELTSGVAGNVPTDSWWHVGALAQSGVAIPTFGVVSSVSKGPAFGGIHFLGHDGDAGTVMGTLIRDAKAKHWGHWQVNTKPDFFIKGYDWLPILGEMMSGTASASDGAPKPNQVAFGSPFGALESLSAAQSPAPDSLASFIARSLKMSANRADENILINRVIGSDGPTTGRGSILGQAEGANPILPYSYYVDSKSLLTLWELLRDVSRRYPEYILTEKLYGFPNNCDATLVFGHPLDWYYAGPDSKEWSDRLRKADADNGKFAEWWKTEGKLALQTALKSIWHHGFFNQRWEMFDPVIEDVGQSPEALRAFLERVLRHESQEFGGIQGDDTTSAGHAWNRAMELLKRAEASLLPGSLEDRLRIFGGALRNVMRSYEAYVIRHTKDLAEKGRVKPIRKYHFIDHNTIVHNDMVVNDKIYNAVRIGDGESNGKVTTFAANGMIPEHHLRTLDVTELINNPKKNVIDPNTLFGHVTKSGLAMAYAQSFLREEVGKMYRGEIILRGVPEIEPWDVLLLLDPSTGMVGAVEVDSVIHSFNLQNGYITIVKPRAVVGVNEASSAQFINALTNAMAVTLPTMLRVGSLNGPAMTLAATKLGVGAAASALGLRLIFPALAKGAVLGSRALSWVSAAGANAATTVGAAAETAGLTGTAAATIEAGIAVEGGAAAASVALEAAGGTLATGAIAFFSTPAGWVVAGVLCVAALTYGSMYWTDRNSENVPLIIVPVTRFNQPWVGGLQGWQVTDLLGVVNQEARQFMADEVYPLLEMWKVANKLASSRPATLPGY